MSLLAVAIQYREDILYDEILRLARVLAPKAEADKVFGLHRGTVWIETNKKFDGIIFHGREQWREFDRSLVGQRHCRVEGESKVFQLPGVVHIEHGRFGAVMNDGWN